MVFVDDDPLIIQNSLNHSQLIFDVLYLAKLLHLVGYVAYYLLNLYHFIHLLLPDDLLAQLAQFVLAIMKVGPRVCLFFGLNVKNGQWEL